MNNTSWIIDFSQRLEIAAHTPGPIADLVNTAANTFAERDTPSNVRTVCTAVAEAFALLGIMARVSFPYSSGQFIQRQETPESFSSYSSSSATSAQNYFIQQSPGAALQRSYDTAFGTARETSSSSSSSTSGINHSLVQQSHGLEPGSFPLTTAAN